MLWGKIIPISEEMYLTSGPAMYVCRFFGLFPLVIRKQNSRRYLSWSPYSALYSFAFGITFLILTYKGYLDDASRKRSESVRFRAEADVFITGSDILAVVLIVVCGVFITPFKYKTFSKFVKCFYKIDAIIPPTDVKQARRLSIFMMSLIFSVIFTSLLIDFFMYLRTSGERAGRYFIFKSYTPFYIIYHIMFAFHFLYWHLAYSIYRRLKLLNQTLTQQYLSNVTKIKQNPGLKLEIMGISSIIVRGANKNVQLNHGDTVLDNKMIYKAISKAITVYSRICDAVEFLNQLVGKNTAATLVGILFHLILTPYFLIMGVYRDNKDVTFIIMQVVWCIIHYGRLMLIAQPCYICIVQSTETKSLVMKMISSSNTSDQLKLQLRRFSTILSQRKLQFTADGLITLDRFLVTTIFSAITTYLVVLVQVGASEKVQEIETNGTTAVA